MSIDDILFRQREFFNSGATLDLRFREKMLQTLLSSIDAHEAEITQALKADLGKSDYESFMCEIGLAKSEIGHMLRNLRRYARPETVRTPLAQFPARCYIAPSPYGNVLIMSPWNYPFLLTVEPLADAIAAGNTAVIKPSAYAPATSAVLAKMLSKAFEDKYVAVITGGRQENAELLNKKFDLVFFTGSQAVGREVLRHTAETLTPAVLELGGKSPCIVDETADIALAAKRIVFGKFINCGQTCVAPDYILCQESVRNKLLDALKLEIKKQYGENALTNPDYGKIINKKHFERIMSLIDPDKVICGGKADADALQIEPTVMANVTHEDAVMQQEIFGPVLPVLTYKALDEIYSLLAVAPKPLALYVFSEDRSTINAVTTRCRYGGGCVNDVVVHLSTAFLPFGGVGESGMGAYHGKAGFDAFSHSKSIMDKKTWLDLPMRYQPYNRKLYFSLIRFFLK